MSQRVRTKGGEPSLAVYVIPGGWAGISVSPEGICRVILPKKRKREVERELARFVRGTGRSTRTVGSPDPLLRKATRLLERYFSGKPVEFDLPLDLRYYTPFQRAVWRAAAQIPRGETRSYGWIAKRIGRPKAARAVGRAMGANPVPVLVP